MTDDKKIKNGYDRGDDLDFVTDSPKMVDGVPVPLTLWSWTLSPHTNPWGSTRK